MFEIVACCAGQAAMEAEPGQTAQAQTLSSSWKWHQQVKHAGV